jgi:hypothetical protein
MKPKLHATKPNKRKCIKKASVQHSGKKNYTMEENICKLYVYDEGLISKIHKELHSIFLRKLMHEGIEYTFLKRNASGQQAF